MLLDTVHLHRGQEFAVGQLRKAFHGPIDADKGFDIVIPGLDVGIPDRPVDAMSVLAIGAEIDIAPTIALTSPHQGPASHMIAPDPVKRLYLVIGILLIVYEKMRRYLIIGIALTLDGAILSVRIVTVITVRQLPGVLGGIVIVLYMYYVASPFQDEGLQSFFT
jgi:hypothetical protein